MKLRSPLLLPSLVVLSLVILGATGPSQPQIGRYTLTAAPLTFTANLDGKPSRHEINTAFLLDTHTGQAWVLTASVEAIAWRPAINGPSQATSQPEK